MSQDTHMKTLGEVLIYGPETYGWVREGSHICPKTHTR